MQVNETERVAKVLAYCGLKAMPPRTILVFQNVDAPTKFCPVRFTPPGLPANTSPLTFLWRGDIADWALVLCIMNKQEQILRYGVFEIGKLGPSVNWTVDERRLCASLSTEVVNATLLPLDGCSGLVEDDPSLKDWMTKRAKEQK